MGDADVSKKCWMDRTGTWGIISERLPRAGVGQEAMWPTRREGNNIVFFFEKGNKSEENAWQKLTSPLLTETDHSTVPQRMTCGRVMSPGRTGHG